MYVSFGEEKIRGNLALIQFALGFFLSPMYHSQQPAWNNSGILSFNFALLVFRINSRMPPPIGGCEFLNFTMVKVLTFSQCLKYQKALNCLRKLAIFHMKSHDDDLKFILIIITTIEIIGSQTLLHVTLINRGHEFLIIFFYNLVFRYL